MSFKSKIGARVFINENCGSKYYIGMSGIIIGQSSVISEFIDVQIDDHPWSVGFKEHELSFTNDPLPLPG